MVNCPTRELTRETVKRLLNDAIDQREEGIVLKDPDSVYKPNARTGGWFKVNLICCSIIAPCFQMIMFLFLSVSSHMKLKPEYQNQLMEHIDLIILGGYHGIGRRRNLISSFLVGVKIPSSDEQQPQEFHSLARVGSGYSDQQLLKLLSKLGNITVKYMIHAKSLISHKFIIEPHWKKWNKSSPPPMIKCGKEKPEVWIEPR